jgi:glutathione S-transferase
MIELVQFPWCPFCIVQRRILKYAGVPFKVTNISCNDRSLVWRLTRHRYYQVPVLRDGRTVVFETAENSQVIAKYLDNKLQLGLFPDQWAGVQRIIWCYVEADVEDAAFRLNDIYYQEVVPAADRLGYIRHKERKFGQGCLEQWRTQQNTLLAQLTERLLPFEQMLGTRTFLLDNQPRFLDFDLFGMLGNFLYSGHYELPATHTRLKSWHERMAHLKCRNRRT